MLRKVEVRIAPNDWELAMDLKIGSGLGIQPDFNGRYAIEARAFDGYNYSVVSRTEVEVTNEGANRRPTAFGF